MKNILIVITQAENAGAQKAVLKLYDYLKDQYNVKITYLFVQDKEYLNIIQKLYDISILMKSRSKKELINLFKIRKLIKTENINLVFTYTHWSNILIPLLTIGLSIKIIANKRGALWKYPKVRLLESLILKKNKIKKIICVSKTLVDEAIISQKISSNKVKYIPNGITCNSYLLKEKNNDEIIKILFVGRLHEQKGIQYLLEGFKKLIAKYQNVKLVMCGDGILKDFVFDYISNNNLSKYIELNGNVKNISEYYMNSNVLISTSLWEGFPNVLLEAACYKLPIIATNIDGNLELIENEKSGFIINSASSDAVCSALEYFINNRKLFGNYSQELLKTLKEKFDDKIIKDKYLEILNEVIAK